MCLIPERFGNRPKMLGSLSDELWKLISLKRGVRAFVSCQSRGGALIINAPRSFNVALSPPDLCTTGEIVIKRYAPLVFWSSVEGERKPLNPNP